MTLAKCDFQAVVSEHNCCGEYRTLARMRTGGYWLTGVVNITRLVNDSFSTKMPEGRPGMPKSGLLQRSSLDNCCCVERTFHFWVSNPENSATNHLSLSDGVSTVRAKMWPEVFVVFLSS